jgi:hypothetical protein
MPAQHAVHRRPRMAQERAQAMGADAEPTPRDEDAANLALGQRPGPAERSGGAILEACRAFGPVPAQPLVRGGPADPDHFGSGRRRPAFDQDPVDQELAAERREPGRTMEHESPPSDWSFDNPKPSTRALTLSTR